VRMYHLGASYTACESQAGTELGCGGVRISGAGQPASWPVQAKRTTAEVQVRQPTGRYVEPPRIALAPPLSWSGGVSAVKCRRLDVDSRTNYLRWRR
jgi:hypothetical protein